MENRYCATQRGTSLTDLFLQEHARPQRGRQHSGREKPALNTKWEREARTEYELDVKQPERVREREIDSKRTEFAQFVNDVWFPLCINDGEHKQSTVEFYRATLKRIVAAAAR